MKRNELSFKLPEVHFSDDDDDETSSTGGSNDSNSLDWQGEAEVGDNSDMAVDFPENRAVCATFASGAGFGQRKEDSAEMQKPATPTQSAAAKTVCLGRGTSTAASSRRGSRSEDFDGGEKIHDAGQLSWPQGNGGSWAPLKLGDVADAQLSKVLDQLQLPDEPADIDITPALTAEPDAARNDELLRQLSQHSLMFSGSRQPKPNNRLRQPAAAQHQQAQQWLLALLTVAAVRQHTRTRSLIGALQAMEASAKRQTVRVDLRHSQAASLQMSDLLRFGPTLLDSSEAKANATARLETIIERAARRMRTIAQREVSGWTRIDGAKQAGWPANSQANLKRPPAQKVSTTAFAGTKTSPVAGGDAASDKDSQPVPAVSQKENGLSKTASSADSINCLAPAGKRSLSLPPIASARLSRPWRPNLVAVGSNRFAHDDVCFYPSRLRAS
uniref:Uncharacterized protein n=1 Tax=Macrostomum lignano TaxID=282301 RepID=A0A1I8FRQ7_9PLAT